MEGRRKWQKLRCVKTLERLLSFAESGVTRLCVAGFPNVKGLLVEEKDMPNFGHGLHEVCGSRTQVPLVSDLQYEVGRLCLNERV